jgi:hypothetical protein
MRVLNYTDYVYYQNTYKGDLIPSNKFELYSRKATQYIKINTFERIDELDIPDEVKMCCCELAELEYKSDNIAKTDGVTSEKVGEYSVSYESTQTIRDNKQKDMRNVLKLWLANTGLLYRGLC